MTKKSDLSSWTQPLYWLCIEASIHMALSNNLEYLGKNNLFTANCGTLSCFLSSIAFQYSPLNPKIWLVNGHVEISGSVKAFRHWLHKILAVKDCSIFSLNTNCGLEQCAVKHRWKLTFCTVNKVKEKISNGCKYLFCTLGLGYFACSWHQKS